MPNKYNSGMNITLSELEDAINYWRTLCPSSGEERALSKEVNTLASLYALMIYHQLKILPEEQISTSAQALLQSWRAQVIKP